MQMMGAKRSNMRAMATLQELKGMLHSTTISTAPSLIKILSDKKYCTGFEIVLRGFEIVLRGFEIVLRGSNYYQEFVFL
jgi:hypothetical protein